MGYAVECALKACIARRTREHDFPDRVLARDSWTHDLELLARTAGLWGDLSAAMRQDQVFAKRWAVVKTWTAAARYGIETSVTEAEVFHEACTEQRGGVLTWIRRRW